MRVLISGASGFIGVPLCQRLSAAGHDLVLLSRNPEAAVRRIPGAAAYSWDALEGPPAAAAVEGVDAVVHLAGVSVVGRWTSTLRQRIRDSRVIGTRNLVQALRASPPRVLVSASAIGYYGDRADETLPESAPPGDDFLARICVEWEHEARRAQELGARVALLRTGIVLHPSGGALQRTLLPARLGVFGPMGSGRQWWSWIHLTDQLRMIEWLLTSEVPGAFNATSPEPLRQRDFARTLGAVLRRPSFVPAPALALRLLLGGFATELLSSKRVVPAATLAAGFRFDFPELGAALRDLLRLPADRAAR